MPNRILLVDDEKDFLDVFGDWLDYKGYAVTKARDGAEALEKLKKGGYDLVILDLMMPKFNGYDFCNAVKNDESLRGTPILVLTAVPKANGMQTNDTYGISGYLEKLTDHTEIALVIDRLIAKSKMDSNKDDSSPN
ncbi:MAG: response regulator [bacterium]